MNQQECTEVEQNEIMNIHIEDFPIVSDQLEIDQLEIAQPNYGKVKNGISVLDIEPGVYDLTLVVAESARIVA